MRTKNSIYNIIGVLILYVTKILFNFAGKTVLIKVMGDQYNGISGLFANIISILSIAELGIGSAIVYNLYKPVKENDIAAVKSLMRFYKKCYHIIAGVVLAAGLCILPFIRSFAVTVSTKESIYVIYLFYLADSVASYFFAYKRSLIYVYQKNYIISLFDVLYNLTLQVCQILVVLFLHNFLLYLLVMVLCWVAENVCIHIYANKHFSFLSDKDAMPISGDVKKDIITKVKGLLFHNVGTYVVMGTDNILISKLAGIVEVGFYSNYNAVFGPLASILKQIITAVQASVGDMLVERDYAKNYRIYLRLELLNFWLYSAMSISVFYEIQYFIRLWIGERYLFSNGVVFCLVLNFWQTGMRNIPSVFKGAAGIFYEDRFVPIIESVVNIVASVLLALRFGIIGIFLGTFISSLCLFFYSYPFLVFKKVFNRPPKEYFVSLAIFAVEWGLIFIITGAVAGLYDKIINIGNGIMDFIVRGGLLFAAANASLLIIHGRSEEFKYYVDLVKYKLFIYHNL